MTKTLVGDLILLVSHSIIVSSYESSLDPNPCNTTKSKQYHPADNCTHFIECFNGKPSLMPCPEGTAWDQEVLTCNHDWFNDCRNATAFNTCATIRGSLGSVTVETLGGVVLLVSGTLVATMLGQLKILS